MKILKYLFIFIVIASLSSCKKDEDNEPQYLLTNENFAGTHELNFLFADIKTTVIVEGLPLSVTTVAEGSVFQTEAVFNVNGTYTLEGQFLLTTTTTGGGITEITEEILVLDENGTYQLNDTAQTVTITGSLDILKGTFNVTLFNETQLRMIKEETTVEGEITTDSQIELRFIR